MSVARMLVVQIGRSMTVSQMFMVEIDKSKTGRMSKVYSANRLEHNWP
jgi:hypothetical protein